MRGFSFLNITGRGVGTVNEPAIRTEEQIISLFPDRETLICRGWVLKRKEGQLWFCRVYLYHRYQKNKEAKSSGKEE